MMAAIGDPTQQQMLTNEQNSVQNDQLTPEKKRRSWCSLSKTPEIGSGLFISAMTINFAYIFHYVFDRNDTIFTDHHDKMEIITVLLWYIGAICGAIACGFNRYSWPTRRTNYIIGVILLISVGLLCFHDFFWSNLILMATVRFIAGCCLGFTYVRFLAQIGDNASKENRGNKGTSIPLAIFLAVVLGILYGNNSIDEKKRKRYYYATNIMLIGIIMVTLYSTWKTATEPITWYLKAGQTNKVHDVFTNDDNNTLSPIDIQNEIDDRTKMITEDYKDDQGNCTIFTNDNWKTLFWMILLRVLNIWTFNLFLLVKTAFIMNNVMITTFQISIIFIRIIALFVPRLLVDEYGRKLFLLISGIGSGICSIALSEYEWNLWIGFGCFLLHAFASIGIEPITHIYSSEAFPLSKRNASIAFLTCFEYLCHGLIMLLWLTNNLSILNYTINCMPYGIPIITIVLFVVLPETAGKTLRECRAAFNSYYD